MKANSKQAKNKTSHDGHCAAGEMIAGYNCVPSSLTEGNSRQLTNNEHAGASDVKTCMWAFDTISSWLFISR